MSPLTLRPPPQWGPIRRTVNVLLLASLTLGAVTVPEAWAADRYVATTGSDAANDCLASGTPCKTITYALTQAEATDVINVAAGTYDTPANGETFPLALKDGVAIIGDLTWSLPGDPPNATISAPTATDVFFNDGTSALSAATRLAGFTLAQADLLRRAMGKKMPEEMKKMKSLFLEGCAKNKIAARKAEDIFDLMEKFAGYGFVRSHSAAYAMLSYQTAYLKAHVPVAFLAASLTSEIGDTDRIVVLVEEARRLGVPILPPDVNASQSSFAIDGEGIRFGLTAVKNVGKGSVDAIVDARARGGAFTSLVDLCRRVDIRAINRRVLESLVQAGACDGLGGDRAQLFQAVGDSIGRAQGVAKRANQEQVALFGGEHAIEVADLPLPSVPPWSLLERLRREREVLGFYLSDHPLAPYRDIIRARRAHDTSRLREIPEGREVSVVAIVSAIKTISDRNGRPMAFVTMEDFFGQMEVTVFADLYERGRAALVQGAVLEVSGRVDPRDGDAPKMVLQSLQAVAAPALAAPSAVHIDLGEDPASVSLEWVREILSRHPGECPVYFHYRERPNVPATSIRVRRYLVRPDEVFLAELRERLGARAVRVTEGGAPGSPAGRADPVPF